MPLLGLVFLLTVLTTQAPAQNRPPTPVTTALVEERDLTPSLEMVGATEACRLSDVAAEVSGKVLEVAFTEGDRVEAGALLVRMDPADMELSLQAARAREAAAEVKLQEARRDLARSANLKASQAIAEQKYEQDLFAVQSLEHTLAEAKAQGDQLADRLARLEVSAPFAGYVVVKQTEVGQWLTPGMPVARLADLSRIRIYAPLPERYLGWVVEGSRAEVVFDSLGDEVHAGVVTGLVPLADEKTRNLPLIIELENPDGRIRAGTTARIKIQGPQKKVLLAPKDALVLDEGRATIFVIKGGKAFPVPVATGDSYGGDIEISGDIAPGQRVVVKGNERLRPGQDVAVEKTPPDTNQKDGGPEGNKPPAADQ